MNIEGLTDFKNNKVEIFTIDGKQILNQELIQYSINIQNLSSGIYFVKVTDKEGKIGMQKITKN